MIHPNQYFDNIYCLNLDRRADRWRRSFTTLRKWGLRVQRYPAVDGSREDIFEQFLTIRNRMSRLSKRRQRTAIPNSGALGCLLSHIEILQDAVQHDYRRVLILEDDILLHRDFLSKFQTVKDLPDDWRLCYLGASQHQWHSVPRYSECFYYARKTLGTFGVAIARALYQPLLDLLQRRQCVVDTCFNAIQARHRGQCFVFSPNLLIADVTDSDIRPGRDQLQHASRMKWDLRYYETKLHTSAEEASFPHCPARYAIAGTDERFVCIHPQVRMKNETATPGTCRTCRFAGYSDA